jgi:metal-responsive CopG/Arc/MetJ family transcriptional regulator
VVIPRYDSGVKTAISLSDELFESADALAARLGISRSQLYATAVEEYVAKHRDEDVTARLNNVYREQDSGMDPALRRAQGRSVRSTKW